MPILLIAQAPPQQIFPDGRFFAPYIMAPYVMTRPTPDLAAIAKASGIRFFTLAFVLDSGNCHAAWGSRMLLDQEAGLAANIEALRAQGGDVLVSFGGASGKELAVGCDSATALQAQYQGVIDKYKITVLDLDIEGSSLRDTASVDRRNAALAAIQAANPGVQVSYTLPVGVNGMSPGDIALLNNAISHGVRVTVVNLMTMDYGGAAEPLAMGRNAIAALSSATAQMLDNGIRARVGIIPMIGLNDTKPEVFSLDDAKMVTEWAQSNPLIERMSMWSVVRDAACPGGAAIVSSGCSGVDQQPYGFSAILNTFH